LFGVDELVRMATGAGIEAEGVEDLEAGLARARELARERDGILLVTGSHYVLAPARATLRLWQD
jgi:hypothetical protein